MTSVTKAVTKVRRTLPHVLAYFEVAEAIMPELQNVVGASVRESLPFLCLAWQWRKHLLKSQRADARHEYAAQEHEALVLAAIP